MDVPYASLQDLQKELYKLDLFDHYLVQDALLQVERSHIDQMRDDGASYLEQHIYPVTISVIHYYKEQSKIPSVELIVAALLHDAIEDDENFTDEKCMKIFGNKILSIVKPLTKTDYKKFPGTTKQEKKLALTADYLQNLEYAPSEAKIIKLADRLNNLQCIHLSPKKEKLKFYLKETEDFYLPFSKKVSIPFYEKLKFVLESQRQSKKVRRRFCEIDLGNEWGGGWTK